MGVIVKPSEVLPGHCLSVSPTSAGTSGSVLCRSLCVAGSGDGDPAGRKRGRIAAPGHGQGWSGPAAGRQPQPGRAVLAEGLGKGSLRRAAVPQGWMCHHGS